MSYYIWQDSLSLWTYILTPSGWNNNTYLCSTLKISIRPLYFFSWRVALFPSPLIWPCDLLRPIECAGSDSVSNQSPALKRPCSSQWHLTSLILQSWTWASLLERPHERRHTCQQPSRYQIWEQGHSRPSIPALRSSTSWEQLQKWAQWRNP
jgi:hypothetical protein